MDTIVELMIDAKSLHLYHYTSMNCISDMYDFIILETID